MLKIYDFLNDKKNICTYVRSILSPDFNHFIKREAMNIPDLVKK